MKARWLVFHPERGIGKVDHVVKRDDGNIAIVIWPNAGLPLGRCYRDTGIPLEQGDSVIIALGETKEALRKNMIELGMLEYAI